MAKLRVIDTIPAFLAFQAACHHRDVDSWLDGWYDRYMALWPELLEMQLAACHLEARDWRADAREHVLPRMESLLGSMLCSYQVLHASCPTVAQIAHDYLATNEPWTVVYYVGIGLGAGWAAAYQGHPAVLFGLENIALCGWTTARALRGLAAHEFSHLWHSIMREQAGLAPAREPWWTLYEEGLATHCENCMFGCPSWHMSLAQPGWLAWCGANRSWLASEFLRLAQEHSSTSCFFGSWYEIHGYSQTGYYLGNEIAALWRESFTLQDIAAWCAEEIERRALHALTQLTQTV